MPQPPSLQFDRVSDTPGRRRIAAASPAEVTLAVAPGAFVTLLGPRGAGQTRLLMHAAGVTRPLSGQVLLDGAPPDRLRRAGGIGLALQGGALFPHFTVRQNIGFPLAACGRWGGRWSRRARLARRRQIELTAELLDLQDLLGEHPARLDFAQARRVALARAVVGEPRLLLLDEPLAGLDPTARGEMLVALHRIHDWLGATTLAAMTEPGEAQALSDRIAVLGPTGIEQVDSPAKLYEQPANPVVAAAFGAINQLPGVIDSVDEDLAIVRLACGPLVEARLAERAVGLASGAACLVLVRPERIAVAAITPAEMGEEMSTADGRGPMAATLLEALDLGDRLRLRFLVGSGAELIVLRPAAAGLGGLAPGRSASIAFQPYHATIFPA